MAKPPCPCTGRTDINCDGSAQCDLAVPPSTPKPHQLCEICWLAIHSAPHRRLWGIDGEARAAPPAAPSPPAVATRQPAIIPARHPTQPIPPPIGAFRAGDKVEAALTAVGITKEAVSAWLGKPCACAERQRKLNALSDWAENALTQGADKAKSLWKKLTGG